MRIGIPKETAHGERRVALVPAQVQQLVKAKLEVLVEQGAGIESGYPDAAYQDKGASIVSRAGVFSSADIVLQVRGPGANPDALYWSIII